MTFRDVAVKNFKANIKNFFSYFLCSTFSISMFFIYSVLLFNNKLRNNPHSDGITILLYISLTALSIFSVFFINYAHSAFIKSRKKEFGVYLTLGMNSDDLQRIVAIENIIIILSSLLAGVITGMLFSRLFQMIVLKLLNIQNIAYLLNYKSFLLTTCVFTAIFIIVIVSSNLHIGGLDISQLLKERNKNEGNIKNSIIPGLFGISLAVFSIMLLLIIASHEKLRSNITVIVFYMLVTFSATYVVISNLSSFLLGLVKGKKYYYSNILSITQMTHKFTENKRIIFILSLLSSMTITLVASPFSLYSLSETIAEMNTKNDLEYAQLGNINKISNMEFQNIIHNSENKVKAVTNIEFISMEIKGNRVETYIPIVSQSVYNLNTGLNVKIRPGNALNIVTDWMPGNHGIKPLSKITLFDRNRNFYFHIQDSVHGKWVAFTDVYKSSSGIILSDKDYNMIKNSVAPTCVGTFRGIKFKDWRKTEGTVDKLSDMLRRNNRSLSNSDKNLSQLLTVSSTIKRYVQLKQGYSLFIFVATFLGVLFFIAGGSVLFFKKYAELNEDRERFYKLYKIGMSEKETVGVVAGELKLIFFTPLIAGSIMGYSFIYLLTFIFGGGDIINKFMFNAAFVIAAYFIFQTAFYLMTKSKYLSELKVSIED